MEDLELWGGPECTVNRTNGLYRDQTRESGHHDRLSDLDRFAELGLRALRYPVLWERVAPNDPAERDWAWADERLSRLRELDVRPIVGLVHHGSGPHYTDLLSDSFAPGLADHAGAVARRYPWIDEYTPVNEPVTTARFSALYGHWHPHRRDEHFDAHLRHHPDGRKRGLRPAESLIGFQFSVLSFQRNAEAQALKTENSKLKTDYDATTDIRNPEHRP